MKPEQQRIAIAEACGWTACGCTEGCNPHGYPPKARKPTMIDLIYGTGPTPWDIPNYLTDLNDMHEAEKVLLTKCNNDPQADLWIDYLANLLMAAPLCLREHATAAQRAEAFLRTLNLWTD